MPDSSLPDELVSEILSPALKVSDEVFSNTDHVSPFATYGESTSAYLIVCKSWLRVATPLLYNTVVLRSKAQAKSLATVLSGSSELGHFIKKLRVEGGFGPAMQTILRCSPNITDLFLTLEIYSSDNTGGLCRGLSLINPSRFILQDFKDKILDNKMVSQLLEALSQSSGKWSNLVVFDCPFYGYGTEAQEAIVPAFRSKQLHTVVIPHYGMIPWAYSTFKACPLKTIQIKQPMGSWERTQLPEDDPVLMSLLKFTHRKNPKAKVPEITPDPPLIPPSLNPSFVPLTNASKEVQDAIWARVLYFAMPPRKLALLMVSKSLHRLALSYYYADIVVRTCDELARLSSILTREPTLGAHICTLSFTYYNWDYRYLSDLSDEDSDDSVEDLVQESSVANKLSRAAWILAIVSRTSNLTRFGDQNLTKLSFVGDVMPGEQPSITWDAFEALVTCSGPSLREVSLCVYPGKHVSPVVFNNFTALRMLLWKSDSVFINVSDISVDALPHLEELRVLATDSSFLSVLSRTTLQSLRRVSFPSRSCGSLRAFLENHGSKLSELSISKASSESLGVELLELCPNLSILSLYWERYNTFPPKAEILHPPNTVPSLEKIVFGMPSQLSSKDKVSRWDAFFADFNPQHLSGLREIQCKCFLWPTTERDIAKSDWVRWADKLLNRHGVHFSDKNGTKWRPRLKVK
ncbi:F-box domain-containing protein [Favolaschia claudopus]|uniref:F-box domain-containing protein n=1 Tax=Favolaschia claudopus TaxID=2862362 RepID=A0AAW0CAR3_9AGAR